MSCQKYGFAHDAAIASVSGIMFAVVLFAIVNVLAPQKTADSVYREAVDNNHGEFRLNKYGEIQFEWRQDFQKKN